MQVNRIGDGLSVVAQVTPEDVPDLAMTGFRAIICNRPDGEGPDQPTHEEVAASAAAAGLALRCLPVNSGMVSDADAAAFGATLRELPEPVLACSADHWKRTGVPDAIRIDFIPARSPSSPGASCRPNSAMAAR